MLQIAFFNAKGYEKDWFGASTAPGQIRFIEDPLQPSTAQNAEGCQAVCIFTNDQCKAETLEQLAALGIRVVALRCAGYNNVDLKKARELGIRVANVPAYSPYSVAEFAITLMLTLMRKVIWANQKVHHHNFALDDLIGKELNQQTVGLIGTGKIGFVLAKILHGFGSRVLAYDLQADETLEKQYGVEFLGFEEVISQSDILSLQVPLNEQTHYLINADTLSRMKDGVMIINTSRGAVINTRDAIDGIKSGKIGAMGLDVYENEEELFFYDHSHQVLQDDLFARLLTFKNVLVTDHQGFLTEHSLRNIVDTTLENLRCLAESLHCPNELT